MFYIKGFSVRRWCKHGNHIVLQTFVVNPSLVLRDTTGSLENAQTLALTKILYMLSIFLQHILYPNSPFRIIKSKMLYSLFLRYCTKAQHLLIRIVVVYPRYIPSPNKNKTYPTTTFKMNVDLNVFHRFITVTRTFGIVLPWFIYTLSINWIKLLLFENSWRRL